MEGGLERAPCALADPTYADISVTLSEAVFDGLKDVDPAILRPAYENYIGKRASVGALCEMRDAAAAILRNEGYLASVQIPPQTIDGGKVHFQLLFARITAVRVRGDVGRAERLFARYLQRLTRDKVFNRKAAERYLLLARDLPGYDVRLVLHRAGDVPGELIGEVTVTRTPVEISANVQNLAGKDSGRFGGQVRGDFYGLTGLGDRTSVSVYSTADPSEQQILQIGHDMRLGGEGLTLSGRFTYAWTDPDLGPGVDVKARTLFATGEASYPFARSQARTISGAVGLDYLRQDVTLSGLDLTRDRLRVGYVRIDGDFLDTGEAGPIAPLIEPRWHLFGSVELRRGLDIFDAMKRCPAGVCPGTPPSRAEGDPTSTVLRASGTADMLVVPGIRFVLAARAQYSWSPLYAFEEISAGNYTIGRGYDPGSLLGDSGYALSGEVRFGQMAPFRNVPIAFQPFAFVDSAWVWNRDRGSGPDPQRLTSVGGGVRASIADRARLDLTLAVPTNRLPLADTRGDVRVLMSLTTRLVPWRVR